MSITDKYEVREELGRGAFSIVKLGIHKETGERVAIKVISKKNVGKDYEKNLKMETAILQKVHHPNIIELKELLDTKDHLYLVMELVTGGELFDKIVEKGSYTESDAAQLVFKIISAVQYLHETGIVHRDLKPENLLLKNVDDDKQVKIADFGLSKIVGQEKMMQTACGTPGYVAPEVLTATGYDKEVDLWSIGVITYILLCGFPPFYNEDVPKLFEQILNADFDYPEEYWKDISQNAKDFINKLLVVDPKKRLTASQALEHDWLKGHASATELKSVMGTKIANYVTLRKQESKKNATSMNI
eukprot:TRINITY_DN872_c0_g1_i1.p1 TRINITY_DN872_c0_g1~~TRINITY_DN872_c0_g1_i1.p1  ORF type:complete len:322 (+),score=86.21 TRINITY_DN872_c0_g1_i1:63-968(+)